MDLELRCEQLAERLTAANLEIAALRARLEDDVPEALSWMQRRCDAQRKALARLNRRVVNQRLVLRTLDQLGRGLSAAEWAACREKHPEQDLDALLVAGLVG